MITSSGDESGSDSDSIVQEIDFYIPFFMVSIDEYCESQSESLEEITIPSSVKKINVSTFEKCTKLRKITFDPSKTQSESNVFESCPSLTHIVISSTTSYIKNDLFKGCTHLKQITFNPENSSYDPKMIQESSFTQLIIAPTTSTIKESEFQIFSQFTEI